MNMTGLRILIIDDSDLCCAVLSVILRSDNFNIVGVAHDAVQGIHLAKLHKPDVVFLDVIMPDVSGLDILVELGALLPETIIIMVSRLEHAEIIRCAMELGADGYITKPFNSASVLGTMRRIKENFILAKPVPDQR
ncbi:two-component system chemotaxis response regulator CheY [Oxalobacteraceae bacterium GrIS 2.11]